MKRKIAEEFLPTVESRRIYEEQYMCCPPPLFIIFITIIQLAFFVYYAVTTGELSPNGPVPVDSVFIFRSDKITEVWRFVFYAVIHAGWFHLAVNLVIQLIVGLPLEMVHGSPRILVIYFAGVIAGSLVTSVFDHDVYLVGASGGVYALIAAHVSNVFLNYSQMDCGVFKLFCVVLVASADVGFAIWNRYTTNVHSYTALSTDPTPVAYVAHLAGAFAGFTMGIVVLKRFEKQWYPRCVWWTSFLVYISVISLAIVYNCLILFTFKQSDMSNA